MTNDSFDSPFLQFPITQGSFVLVDPIDADLFDYKWQRQGGKWNTFYAQRTCTQNHKRITLMLHRVILERMLGRPLTKGETCDHENRNGLDCRRSNLRLATPSQNNGNQGPQKNNTSGYKGVTYITKTGKWCAKIHIDRRHVNLGYFFNILDAARAYNEAASNYFGEFAYLNPIPE